MTIYTHIQGGTGAGIKKAPLSAAKENWVCAGCGRTCTYYWRNCPSCFHARG